MRIAVKVERSVVLDDCCTRVLRRSAGWRRTAERSPDARPAAKWNAAEREVSLIRSFHLDLVHCS